MIFDKKSCENHGKKEFHQKIKIMAIENNIKISDPGGISQTPPGLGGIACTNLSLRHKQNILM